jgi:hypothetical protein
MLHSLTHPFGPHQDPVWQEVEKLVGSEALHGSESLCKLLRYLAKHALEEPGVRLKEYQIATEVFGRPADFDPQSDSMIRVQAGRLRAKLNEYYKSSGAEDRIIIELPKGSYQLQFHRRGMGGSNGGSAASSGTAVRHEDVFQKWKLAAATLAVMLLAAIAVIVSLAASRKNDAVVLADASEAGPAELQQLWKPFISIPQEPWLIFSNAAFIGRPETGMRYYDPAEDPKAPVWDHYTGVGEVLAVHELDQAFSQLHRQIRVKRGSLFSLDDVRNNNLIFLGSPSENLTLTEIPTTHEFVFQRITDGPRKGDLGIVNIHPRSGEAKTVLATLSGLPLTEDYAVIAFIPGLDPSHSVMIFAGTTTFGTQGAVEYVCRQDTLKKLLSRLQVSKTGELKPFEALLRVRVAHGVPVSSDLLAVRP